MSDRWAKKLMAGLFAFLAVACVSAAGTVLLGDGQANPSFAPAVLATAVIFAAFACWLFLDIDG